MIRHSLGGFGLALLAALALAAGCISPAHRAADRDIYDEAAPIYRAHAETRPPAERADRLDFADRWAALVGATAPVGSGS